MSLRVVEGRGARWSAAACTDPGLRRSQNEDALLFLPEAGRFAVIDGMGGQSGGEVASAIARDLLASASDPAEGLRKSNEAIFQRAQAEPGLRGMGCVATAVALSGATLRLAHVGDTRAWLTSDDGSQQLTRDHTVVEEAREKALAEGQAQARANQHVVTRDLGGQTRQGSDWIDQVTLELRGGELLLLASDGLHDVVSESEVFSALRQARSQDEAPAALVRRLVELALSRGGPDNVSVLALRFDAVRDEKGGEKSKKWPILGALAVLLSGGVGLAVGRVTAPVADAPPVVEAPLPPPPSFAPLSFDPASCPCTWTLDLNEGSRFSLSPTLTTATRLRLRVEALPAEATP